MERKNIKPVIRLAKIQLKTQPRLTALRHSSHHPNHLDINALQLRGQSIGLKRQPPQTCQPKAQQGSRQHEQCSARSRAADKPKAGMKKAAFSC
jgi:hypothetical protein